MASEEDDLSDRVPSANFRRFASRSPFVNRIGAFWIRDNEDGSKTVGTFIDVPQSNAEQFAHGGFLMAFCDFALSTVVVGITLTMSVDFFRAARIGDWVEARIVQRKRTSTIVFADASVEIGGRVVMSAKGLFQPFVKKD